ncbi:restriction endonuclease subunit S [Thalassolituus sp.]|jgi:type I restriction enzyme S subunit|uniref:restriction endonuclease subunit S n=1 Tax=Thalassolituus sp. TaxID=2030822 RepID=UPI002A7F2BDC|nr:restriction endonuclease subunit S [Thalassolituus sp.]
MLPEGWELKELQFLCKKIAVGLAISVTPFMRASGAKLIRNQNIKRNYFNSNSVVYIDEVFADSNKSKRVRHGDVVAVRTGSNIGEACVVPEEFDGALTFTTLIARPNPDFLDSFYLSTHINSDRGVAEVNRLCAGGGKPNLNSGELKRYRLLTPPLPEQKKIAQILSTWDKAITTTEQLLVNSQQQKKALMQQLLTGKKRLLDENGVRFSGEWKEINLGKSVKVIGGNAFKSEEFKECGIPVVRISNIKPDYSINMDSSIFVSEDSRFNRFKIINGDILIAMSGATTGKIGMYNLNTFSYLNQRVGKFEPIKGRASKNYLFQLFKQPKIQYNVLIDAVGGAQPNISNKDIERIKVLIPALSEQQKIAAVLSTADQEITVLQQKLHILKLEKKALMQQLLTGKRRVIVDKEAVA